MQTLLESPERELTAADRCDRCGAQAYIQAVMGDIDLMFCGHHGKKIVPTLDLSQWVVLDSTHKLEPTPYVPEEDEQL